MLGLANRVRQSSDARARVGRDGAGTRAAPRNEVFRGAAESSWFARGGQTLRSSFAFSSTFHFFAVSLMTLFGRWNSSPGRESVKTSALSST